MPNPTEGSVVSLWRYPVKSMLGEELSATEVTQHGLLGDRAYALIDGADGKAATPGYESTASPDHPAGWHYCHEPAAGSQSGSLKCSESHGDAECRSARRCGADECRGVLARHRGPRLQGHRH